MGFIRVSERNISLNDINISTSVIETLILCKEDISNIILINLIFHRLYSGDLFQNAPLTHSYLCEVFTPKGGRDSVVGIATRYGLDSPGIEASWGRDFPRPSRTAPGPIQLLVQ